MLFVRQHEPESAMSSQLAHYSNMNKSDEKLFDVAIKIDFRALEFKETRFEMSKCLALCEV